MAEVSTPFQKSFKKEMRPELDKVSSGELIFATQPRRMERASGGNSVYEGTGTRSCKWFRGPSKVEKVGKGK